MVARIKKAFLDDDFTGLGYIEILLGQQFSFDKIRDDDSAILFYTAFPSYQALISFYKFIEPKLGKMQYWKGEHCEKVSLIKALPGTCSVI